MLQTRSAIESYTDRNHVAVWLLSLAIVHRFRYIPTYNYTTSKGAGLLSGQFLALVTAAQIAICEYF